MHIQHMYWNDVEYMYTCMCMYIYFYLVGVEYPFYRMGLWLSGILTDSFNYYVRPNKVSRVTQATSSAKP